MTTDNLGAEAGKGLQNELEGMPAKEVKVSFHGMRATIEGDLAEELRARSENQDLLGLEFSITGSGYVRHDGRTWLEGKEGRRAEITIQLTDVKVKPKK